MIYCYILLAVFIVFILMLYFSYTISYLPLYIPNEIVKQGGTIDISEFIELQEEQIKYEGLINDLQNSIYSSNEIINKYNNTIDIQETTIETLKNTLRQLEEVIDQQQNIQERLYRLQDTIQPLVTLMLIERQIKIYIYNKIKYDLSLIIILSRFLPISPL
ncbi:ORF MSV068 hypothetical protein [Melanoplus sanguinipes entomopoxvirus]|uniref:Uncharacterized protein n=1 Tax=Melanoplus sanguinipes entomopoxvirus TaxID=83191 RepID=Q9YW24_MSEPV|nr:ORF MSV068 hypothetical protein [Melanoplus sanguinipes entomopoxvirus]AAC97625.1 ORF MSV068 hypothetical protein [Melanoplus sanguinipes entomopoxvirus 'O']